MIEGMTEEEARQFILSQVGKYCDKFHSDTDLYAKYGKVNYAGRIYDHDEMVNLVDASLDFWLTSGSWADAFEKKLSKFLDIPFVSLVNSGSSANMLAFMALTASEHGDRAIMPGDEVITTACCFPTTVTPIIQYGAVPVFVDVTLPNANIDVSQLEEAVSSKTKAVMIAHTLGNPFDLVTVKRFCEKYDLWLIEDNCDALGSEYKINGANCLTGTVGDIGTSSFYASHHITMGEGGAVYTSNPVLHRIIRSLRDWGRDCSCMPGEDNHCGHRFDGVYKNLPYGYDHKYVYSKFGYNLKATDLQAAIGCAQMDKLRQFIDLRRSNFTKLSYGFDFLCDQIMLPVATDGSNPSWFGYLMTCCQGIDRNAIVRYLEHQRIQTRMLFAGNLVKQPCFDDLSRQGKRYRIVGDLNITDRMMRDSFWIGLYPGLSEDAIEYAISSIKNYFQDGI